MQNGEDKTKHKKILLLMFIGIIAIGLYLGLMTAYPRLDAGIHKKPAYPGGNDTFEKPVIYFENYSGKQVTVRLDVTGTVNMTYPAAKANTWTVSCNRDNSITYNGNTYRYLFWDGTAAGTWSFSEGYCVKKENTVAFLENITKYLGLNTEQSQDFITYWAPRMMQSPYTVISFQKGEYTSKAKLIVDPAPDTTYRIFMAWYPSNTKVDIKPQKFTVPKRKGKVLVEWGGTEVAQTATAAQTTPVDSHITPAATDIPQASVPADPYAQYGQYAECAKAWDSTAALKCGKTWASLDEGTKQAAYNHYISHGTEGW